MRNAAGDHTSSEYIPKELAEARVNIDQHTAMIPDPEIKTHFTGNLHGWTFRRAWYYWIARCEDEFNDGLELKYALPLHNLIGQEVRLAGHCGCPSPVDNCFLWCTIFAKDGKIIMPKKAWNANIKFFEAIADKSPERMGAFKDKFIPMYAKDIKKAGDSIKIVSNSYHIDTQEGFNIFTNVLKKRQRDIELIKENERRRKKHEEYLLEQENKKQ